MVYIIRPTVFLHDLPSYVGRNLIANPNGKEITGEIVGTEYPCDGQQGFVLMLNQTGAKRQILLNCRMTRPAYFDPTDGSIMLPVEGVYGRILPEINVLNADS